MSVKKDFTCVPPMPLVPTPREATTVHVTLDTMEMGSLATVSDCTFYLCLGEITISLIDTDECLDGIDKCHSDAECSDTYGSYLCVCHDGYAGDGYNCTGTQYRSLHVYTFNHHTQR